jgi:hypothetical protein
MRMGYLIRVADQVVDVEELSVGSVSGVGGPGFQYDFTQYPLSVGEARARSSLMPSISRARASSGDISSECTGWQGHTHQQPDL